MRMKPTERTRTLTPVQVLQIHDITPSMRRLTLVGDGLRNFVSDKPAQWVKVFFPAPDQRPPASRAYTIRRLKPADGQVELELVLHGDNGPASYWLSRAKIGDTLQLSAPRAGAEIRQSIQRYILLGDITALPAMSAIAADLPAQVQAEMFVEVANQADEQRIDTLARLKVHWLYAGKRIPGTTGQLEQSLKDALIDITDCQFWVAGESSMVKTVVTHLLNERLVQKSAIQSAGYWKLGVKGHREESGK
ncbi:MULTISPECIES: siderophore-interacting protein [unclassified Undibacterium]|uniref:siderophore-interacting protein n=1 Tax=unclassified Undibacterium TaxID=2630295 RepID=UPI002AC8C33C|nr:MULTISPECIES: siderophore-interacting protein [unclassified Undibacterium]MEB0140903.1 siderophore-interacting protein [Undibacterium sp. CCC2.1]MEB0173879.1 siderophore-interacting protein [Undibacterium sp. CCC1.1]MEB0176602.1 siderophore-interacting protein [Undibacterium sp. CCC3.4]MEB0217062.1 siderophore-interacting protein [Undibacterium sp. 5I2]WPX44580.1 siderophore-interacting protein [Undibacterium sp. CCC3.4]